MCYAYWYETIILNNLHNLFVLKKCNEKLDKTIKYVSEFTKRTSFINNNKTKKMEKEINGRTKILS